MLLLPLTAGAAVRVVIAIVAMPVTEPAAGLTIGGPAAARLPGTATVVAVVDRGRGADPPADAGPATKQDERRLPAANAPNSRRLTVP